MLCPTSTFLASVLCTKMYRSLLPSRKCQIPHKVRQASTRCLPILFKPVGSVRKRRRKGARERGTPRAHGLPKWSFGMCLRRPSRRWLIGQSESSYINVELALEFSGTVATMAGQLAYLTQARIYHKSSTGLSYSVSILFYAECHEETANP